MKLNGHEQNGESENHTNGTDKVKKFPPGVVVSDVLLECSVCNITFDSLTDYETHFISLQHVQRVLVQNSMIALPLTNPIDQSNKKCGDKTNEQKQEEKLPSSSKASSALLTNKASKPPGPYSCAYCIKDFNGAVPYKQHLDSKAHKKKVALESNLFSEIKRINGIMFCDFCKKEFTGMIPYNEHLMSQKHKMMEQNLQIVPSTASENNTDEDSAPKAKKVKLETSPGNERQWFCEICKIQCSGPIPYSQHLNANDHKKKEAWSKTGINIGPSINQLDSIQTEFSSEVAAKISLDQGCSEYIKQSVQFFEENSKEDSVPQAKKMKLDPASENERQWLCEICKIQCSGPIPYSQHLAGSEHKKNQAGCQANIEISVNQLRLPTPYKDDVNHVNISVENVDPPCTDNTVIKSPTLEKIESEKKDNEVEVVKLKSPWFCTDCNVQCTGAIDFSQHVGGKSHRKKLKQYLKDNYYNEPKVTTDGTKLNVNGSTEGGSFSFQKQNMSSENIDYEKELKKRVKIFSPDEEVNFD